MTMEVYDEKKLLLQVAVVNNNNNKKKRRIEEVLSSQMEQYKAQIDELERLVSTQLSLTSVNPLSQEMAAGALSINIGKRPRDLLNPKAVKYMQSVFSVKDAINKRETREISALLGVTVSQVREFFNGQRTRVRKHIRLSQEKGLISCASEQKIEGVPMSDDSSVPIYPMPLKCLEPIKVEEGASSTPPVEIIPGIDESEKHFQENIFMEMRKEETIRGQVKLMEWMLRIQNSSLLLWFLTNDGVMILVTWLSQAASEEQTSVLYMILKVLCHLPLQKALPVHMSAILQSVNRLRFYKAADISNRARNLLSRWSKMFARAQALKRPHAIKSSSDAENEMLLKQSISEVMGDESWESNLSLPGDPESADRLRVLGAAQPLKLLTASADDSSKKPIGSGSPFYMRERRKVLMVEHPGQKPAGRSSQVARSVASNQSRPLSADDIQKAKIRAQFMQNKNGKSQPSQTRPFVSPSKVHVKPQVKEHKSLVVSVPRQVEKQGASIGDKMNIDVDEPLWKKCKKVQIKWQTPAELRIPDEWSLGTGEDSKEIEFQKNRNRREKETIYRTTQEIPCDPNQPWDREMEYDDTLTLEIPIEQLPDNEVEETEPSTSQPKPISPVSAPSYVSTNTNNSMNFADADPQLLAELLKYPELVFALQKGGLSGDEMVKLLDMIKANGVAALRGSGLANGGIIVTKVEDNIPVSLPSPTPSSEHVTSGWTMDVKKNPFSHQEREPFFPLAQQHQQLQTRILTPPQQVMPQYTENVHQMHSVHTSNFTNIPPNNHSAPIWAQNPGYVDPTTFSVINRQQERQLPPPPQPRFVPEQTWGHNGHSQSQVLATSSHPHYMQPHRSDNYNGYVQQGHSPPYRERNEYVSRAEFESWSPENSPTRNTGYRYPEQRTNPNANLNPNPNIGHYYNSRPPEYDESSRQWNSSSSRDFNGTDYSKRRRR